MESVEEGGSSLCRSVSLASKIPAIIASFDRLRRNRVPIEPREDLGHASNFLYMLTGKEPDKADARALETYFILLAEHGMNASTFSARVTASTLGDVYSSVVTALGTLKGPLHGGASHRAMEQLMEIGSVENVDAWFEKMKKNNTRIMGFGHRVYKVEDPRATILRRLAKEISEKNNDTKWFEIAKSLEERVLSDPHFKDRKLFTNVDYYTAPLLHALGIPIDQFTPLFALARVAGWTAHILEQQSNNRLIRPRAEYTGDRNLNWVDISNREKGVEADSDTECVEGKPANCPASLRIPPQFQ